MNHGRARASRGFTLVELIAAITITVLISSATVALLRTTGAARERVDRQMAAQGEARAAVHAITTSLRNVYRPVDHKDQRMVGIDEMVNGAATDRLSFFTISRRTIRPGQPESDVRNVAFFIGTIPGHDLPALMRRTDPTRNEEPDEGGVIERIARRVVALDFQYHDGINWVDRWEQREDALPLAVRVRVAVAEDDAALRRWPVSRVVYFPWRSAQGEEDES